MIIGQLFDTYWLVQYADKLYIIDQHAAHEKVLYERLMKDLRNRTFQSPVIIAADHTEFKHAGRGIVPEIPELFYRHGI